MRDERDLEAVRRERCDREADALDGDRSLFDDVAQELLRRLDRQPGALPFGFQAEHAPHTVDVALDEVPAKGLAGPQGRLDVHRATVGQTRERAAAERLRNCVEGQDVSFDLDGGQAHAVHGDGVAGSGRAGRHRRNNAKPDPR